MTGVARRWFPSAAPRDAALTEPAHPRHSDRALSLVRREDVALRPDPARHLDAVTAVPGAGFDEVHGDRTRPGREGLLGVCEHESPPRLRAATG